ncbi:asparagine synthase (glutamine-hydrolysing) [Desulfonatronum thiosulfatophilum]|uniref:asparagine synthase (glutamine-hydrolyzing) n=1 Tax=Desulfonatronum thiosulfatophilum TaxID=617002 RepID=A0A1G6DPK7_9BACT|nr:N-acetylglutaminylglutamine amidotransferase [Desulfonatronum thiosulfatophilum]SDB47050.1 asparagine synthase (glutamine-hydrolysing) [Desulfonatronum thiosulfatophilum]
MCGICGELRFDRQQATSDNVQEMTRAMAARGPDGSGILVQKCVALGHRRLKIIDLSDASQQPMIDSELGLACVFNGIVYNYKELRLELESMGYRFFSSGDTEVLLKAYHAWGEDCVQRFMGMFAFAVLERDSGTVLLGRDRLGIKPLYLAEVPGGLLFASSLPALLATGKVDTTLDPVALHHYFSFHAVVPAPHTLFQGIRKLPPATLMRIEADGTRRQWCYWQPEYRSPEPGKDETQWRDEVLAALRRAVDRRMVADVPVGVLLSGGLDSSLVVGLLAEAGVRDLETFSIGFESVGGETGDEFMYSDIVAKRFGTRHHKIAVSSRETLDNMLDCVRAMSEPMVSHDNIGFYLLSREVAKHVKVVQSGQGADEVFAGYHWYPPMLESRDAVTDYARLFCDRDHADYARLVEEQWCRDDHSLEYLRTQFAQPGADRAIDKALRMDALVMLVDDPVKRVDNMTMAWGLEARVPFLDHELVELAARVPAELKIREGGKYILKEAARSIIPHEVIDRPKGYFPVPALKYLQGPFLDFVVEVLQRPEARSRGIVREDYLADLLRAPEEHITPLGGSKLWQVAVLELWLQEHGIA